MTNQLEEIKKILVNRKSDYLGKLAKELKNKNKKIKQISLDKLEEEETKEIKIKTGTLIDEIIGGGIPETEDMMLYGEFGSGKTQTCFTAAVLCPNGVIYINTEGSFKLSRIKEICESREIDYGKVKEKLILYKPQNWGEQMLVLHSLPSPADIPEFKIDLIICDSISKLFRGIEFVGRETLGVKLGMIREFCFELERLAKQHRAAIIFTTQIYDKPQATAFSGPSDIQMPVGGHSLEHQPAVILHFRKGRGNIRIARMMDSSWNPLGERAFVINEKGIDDLPETAPAFKTQKKYEEKFEKKQEQEKLVSKSVKKENNETEENKTEKNEEK